LAGCDSQVDGDYQGEVLATLDGTMHAPQATSAKVDVAIVWALGRAGIAFVGTDHAEVEGSLPSSFTISVFGTPTEEMMKAFDDGMLGGGYIVAYPRGNDPKDWQSWLGVDFDHVLVYLPEDVTAGSGMAGRLRSTPTAGYHVFSSRKITNEEHSEQLACWNMLSTQLGRTPTEAEVFAACAGDSHDPLLPTELDLGTTLSIELLDHPFGVPEYNRLPRWYPI
jgi:hypothetical protein